MEQEKMISKIDRFIKENGITDGFTAYMAYCYIFDMPFEEHIRIDSDEMSFEDFREWLDDYMYNYHVEYEQISIFGCYDDVYCNFGDFRQQLKNKRNMKEEKMISKLEDFLLDFDYLEGFTTYRAYCYVFDLHYDLNIHYDEHNRVIKKTQLGTKTFIQIYENSKHTYSKYEDESSFKEEWYDFNKNGKIVHIKEHEELFECDKQGNRLHVKSIFEIEKWWKYNEHGKIIHYKDSSGKEYINVYDGNEHKIILEDKQGNRQIEEYDDDWDLIYSKAWNGDECWKEYYDKQRQND